MKRTLLTLLTALFILPALADEGMWLPSLISSRIDDMRAKGFRLTAEDIYSVNQASMKDAVVLFNGGCTGELISPEGLLLTNHHCGYGAIQRHSTVEHDYLTDGFWAMSRAEELPNEKLWVRFLVRMEEVTDRIAAGETADEIVKKAEAEAPGYKAAVEQMYYGNQQFLFVYEQFDDVRLVAAPPSSIGKFGGDTDNWIWPRHTGDFSMFRVYASKENKPAPYSPQNVPYRPKKHFTISTKGVKEGDFTMIYGFPGNNPGVYPLGRRGLHRRAFRPGEDRRPHGPSRHHLQGAGVRSRAAHLLRRPSRLDRQRLEEVAGRGAGHRTPRHRGLETRL